MSKIIVVASGKGGVGKTTTALNLGAAISSFDEDVIIVDANLTTPNIGLHLGAPIVPVSLNHVLLGKAKISDAIYEHESGTKIIPASLSIKDMKKISDAKLISVIQNLKQISDYIILDCGAGLGEESLSTIKTADEIILVTNPNMPAVTDAFKTIKVAEELNKIVRGVIITRVKNDKVEMPISNIKEMLEVPIIGVVPEDSAVPESLTMKKLVLHSHPKSKAAKSYKEIAAKLLGKKIKTKKEKGNLFKRFLKSLKLGR